MLLKQLSLSDKRDFLCLAELISMADKPISICKKYRIESFSGKSFNTNLSIQRSDAELAAIDELAWKCGNSDEMTSSHTAGNELGRRDIEPALLKRFDKLPHYTVDVSAARITATLELLRDFLKGKKAQVPSVPKLMLFELMLFSLSKGRISSIEWQLLDEFKHHHQLENHIFNDLLERAEFTHREAQKTLAIILE